MRVLLTLAYDGRSYEGWQSQPSGNTIQDLLESAIASTAKSAVRIHGAGRTDAGVHALAQAVHFDAPDQLTMTPENWQAALNAKLPPGIRVTAARSVPADFHARFSAVSKTYRYEIDTTPVLSPFRHGLAWHLPRGIDPEALAAAVRPFAGNHDFEAYCARRGNETPDTDHRRTLLPAVIRVTPTGLSLIWQGDGFLYKMVRLLTGTAVMAAQGRLDPGQLEAWLDQPPGLPRSRSPHCAPADGLYLEKVDYPADAFTHTGCAPA